MKTITVNVSKTYDIMIGTSLLDEAGAVMRKAVGGQTAAIVTDSNVDILYSRRLADTLAKNGYHVVKYVFPCGESSKSAETFLAVINYLAEKKLSRTDVVVALGGGVVGDLAGFAAACYLRGIRFAQVPTTLLAAVDSSVGGKTGINLSAGKNLIGAFYQPDVVICDTSTLTTIPPEVYRDGFAEIVKYGAIADRELFSLLEKDLLDLEDVIFRCCDIKRQVVETDELDTGRRMILNFGHTFGHAIETAGGFYRYTHGQAVAIGMVMAAELGERIGITQHGAAAQIRHILTLYGLPTEVDTPVDFRLMFNDKKRDGDSLRLILLREIGEAIIHPVPLSQLEDILA